MDLNQLLQLRKEKQDELVAIRSLMVKEDRQMNEDEAANVEEITRSISEFDKNIELAEQAEVIERSVENVIDNNQNQDNEMNSLELVRSLAQDGQKSEAVGANNAKIAENVATQGVFVTRNYSHATNGGDMSPTRVQGLNVLEGKSAIWAQCGATLYTGLKGGTQKLPFMDAFAGQLVAEKGAIARDETAPAHVELTPERYGIQIEVTREGLTTYSQTTWNGVLDNASKAIDRKISATMYSRILAGATEEAAGAISKAGFDALEGAVPVDGAYFMARKTFFESKGEVIGGTGSGRFLTNRVGQDRGETYEGTPIFHSGLFEDGANQQYVVYGVTDNIALGFWGDDAYEIIVDPYTKAASGVLVITISRIADIKIPNVAKAFAKSPDLDAAV